MNKFENKLFNLLGGGADGKSAYDIWLENGHTGSEVDFLNSLKGPAGPSKIADNLTTTDPTYALSAYQGKLLKDDLTVISVKLERNIYNAPDNSIYKCFYIPFLQMCFVRMYIGPRANKDFIKDELYTVYTVPEQFRPSKYNALTVTCIGDSVPDARISKEGEIIIRPRLANLNRNYTPYITGFWFVD